MIHWMQKHKKYLIITIWISTIAFVGAGFVGWGSYSFSSTSNAVAIVGEKQITIAKLQREYARLYSFYNQIFNGNLDDEQAKKIGIEEQALNTLISRYLMINYAYDLGLRVQEKEIIETIMNMQEFKNNDKFDETIYKRLLADNQLRPKDFEEELKEGILLQKLNAILDIPLTNLEKESIMTAFLNEDKVGLKVLDSSMINYKPSEEEIQQYWSENKDIYQTQRGYEIASVLVKIDNITPKEEDLQKYYEDFKNQFLDENGQLLPYNNAKNKVIEAYKTAQAEKESLKEYIALRKGENQKAQITKIFEGDKNFNQEIFNALSTAKEQDTLKPIKINNGYLSIKVLKIIPSTPKEYALAKADAAIDLTSIKTAVLLEEKAKAELENLKTIEVGYLSRDSKKTLPNLNANESEEFISKLFSTKNAKGYIQLKDKIVLYEIFNQRLKNFDIMPQNLDFLTQNGTQIKARLIDSAFMEYLSKTYKIVRKI
ncbi:MAG: peptidylprolyl isomerase [Helicobacteraceae bacterium]|nr:peptidylprolyl isomerase [Helicobacteraceae bacterium]